MFIQMNRALQRSCAGLLVLGTLVAWMPAPARARPTTSTLTGPLIVGVGLKTPPIDTTSTPRSPIMTLEFSGIPDQTVVGTIIPTTLPGTVVTATATIRAFGLTIPDVCLDTPAVSSVLMSSGTFDPVSGDITGLALTITRQHALTPTTGTRFGSLICGAMQPRDDISVVLSTTGSGGVALNAAGTIAMVGSATVVTPTATFSGVPVSVAGTLAPLPDRTAACNGVSVPDVTDSSDLQNASDVLQNAGLHPVFGYVGGPSISDPYISFQNPAADSCVAPGTTVHLTVRAGPVP
jgi:hypothetical protein